MARGPQLAGGRHIATYYTIVNCIMGRRVLSIVDMHRYLCISYFSRTGKRVYRSIDIIESYIYQEFW